MSSSELSNSPGMVSDSTSREEGWPQADLWHASTPKAIREAHGWNDGDEGWQLWQKELARKSRPQPIWKLASKKQAPLTWALPESITPATRQLLASLDGLDAKKKSSAGDAADQLHPWLAENAEAEQPSRTLDANFALECLAWAHAVAPLAAFVAAEDWWRLVEFLTQVGSESAGLSLGDQPWEHQLLCGELPLVLASQLPELKHCRQAGKTSHQALSRGAVDLLDGEGQPAAANLPFARPLMACWTRCVLLGQEHSRGCWDKDAKIHFSWVPRVALAWSRADGSQMLEASKTSTRAPLSESLIRSAAKAVGEKENDRIAKSALAVTTDVEFAYRAEPSNVPFPSNVHEWAESALLRTVWNPERATSLALTFNQRNLRAELNVGRDLVFSGSWQPDISFNGERLTPEEDWTCVCWESDSDGDYLELEMKLSQNVCVQRQILLAREDEFLFVADAVMGQESGQFTYQLRTPISLGVQPHHTADSRELYLIGRRRLASVMPLAMPEWQSEPFPGSLTVSDTSELVVDYQPIGRAFFAPLFFDLDPKRISKALTWRRLTVAQDREIQPPEVAVGYRVQSGGDQWLIYRSLTPKTSRTLLGQNVVNEFLIARFEEDGDTTTLIEIE